MAEISKDKAISKGNLVFTGNGTGGCELEDLLRSDAEILGNGTFGTSYRANLEHGAPVAVKRLSAVPEKEFSEKVEELGKMVHENLIPLRAYYYDQNEGLLLYDYMPIGSLSKHLHGKNGGDKTPLSWDIRSNIAYGIARAIEYLHSQGPEICHGNIRSSNVFLTNAYDAQLSEYCVAQLVAPFSSANLVAGYRAPEVTNTQQVSQKADVYSFGVLLLELLTGMPPVDALSKNLGVDLPKTVRQMFQEKPIIDVFDTELPKNQNNVAEQMVQMLQLAICCTFRLPDKRPSMTVIRKYIKDACQFRP